VLHAGSEECTAGNNTRRIGSYDPTDGKKVLMVGSKDCPVGNNVRPTGTKICSIGSALRPTGKKFCSSRSKVWEIDKKVLVISKKICATDANDCTTRNNACRSHKKFTKALDNVRWRHSRRRKGGVLSARTHHASGNNGRGGGAMNTKQRRVRRSVRRARDVLVAHEAKNDVAELAVLRKDLNDAIDESTNGAAAQKAIAKQSPVHTMEIKRLRRALRDRNMRPIVRMSGTIKLVINNTEKRGSFSNEVLHKHYS